MTISNASAELSVARAILAELDLTRPDLDEVRLLADQGQSLQAVLAFIRRIRQGPAHRPAYSPEFVTDIRRRATPAQCEEARAAIQKALQAQLVTHEHGNPISATDPITLLLGLDEALCMRIAESVWRNQQQWNKGGWGVTHSIVELIRILLAVPECPDEVFLPALGWLDAQSRVEWEWARTWNESLLGNSGHNWWLHTFRGFFKAGLFLPEFKRLAQFRSLGAAFFDRECRILLEVDGFTKERSGYHYGTAVMFREFQELAEKFGFPLSPAFRERMRAAAVAEWKVLAPTGDVPHLGDGWSVYPEHRELEALRVLAVRFQLPEAKFVAEHLDPGWKPRFPGLLLHGEHNLASAYDRLSMRPPAELDTALPATGYYFMRQNWTPKADWMSIEAGPTGTIVSSHDHTDIFSIELYSRGRPILVDNGSGPYGNSPERVWRVGSAGHNVAMIDNKDQIPMDAKWPEWRWDNTVTPFVDAWISDARYAYFSGAHEGYRSLPDRVASCRRKIFYLRGEYWILIDRFTPETEAAHEYQLRFHILSSARLVSAGRLVTTGQGGNLLIVPVAGLDGKAALAPCPFPLEGYIRPDLLTYTRQAKGPQIFVTLLVPFDGQTPPDIGVTSLGIECDARALSQWEATALEISFGGRRDVYFDMHMAWNLPWQTGGIKGEGRLFHSQCSAPG
jgi:hypothetical protein